MSDKHQIQIEKKEGILFVLTAPSGAGKTTVANLLVKSCSDLERSVSYTTRPKRDSEQDGIDYHFVEDDIFSKMIEEEAFIEWAKVHNNYYGTSLSQVKSRLAMKKDLIAVIDIQGAASIRKLGLNSTSIFLMAPSLEVIKERLAKRGDVSSDSTKVRLANYKHEMSQALQFDYIVINDKLDNSKASLIAIVEAERKRASNLDII
ncbi:MAG: guanylate kinase [Nitrospinota bacterium]